MVYIPISPNFYVYNMGQHLKDTSLNAEWAGLVEYVDSISRTCGFPPIWPFLGCSMALGPGLAIFVGFFENCFGHIKNIKM